MLTLRDVLMAPRSMRRVLGRRPAGTVGCPTPGLKIRSRGLGRGLGFGRGFGPMGIPYRAKRWLW